MRNYYQIFTTNIRNSYCRMNALRLIKKLLQKKSV